MSDIRQNLALFELVTGLDALQRHILFTLRDKGAGLPLEIAVRLLRFPEDIAQPMAALRDAGLVRAEPFSGGQLGGEIISLTDLGQQAVEVLRDEAAFSRISQHMQPPPTPAADPLQEEIALLNKLGDLARESGDTAKAMRFYEQALEATRTLRSHRS